MSSLKALRDAGRFVGKEDTVPLRLLYSRHNHSQITQDELSTRVEASSGSAQVGVDGERGVCREMPSENVSVPCMFVFALFHLLPCPCPQRVN